MQPVLVKPPTSRDEVSARLLGALEKMESEEAVVFLSEIAEQTPDYYKEHLLLEHSIPSPSSITDCRLKLWFRARSEPETNPTPIWWRKRSATGIIMEPYWITLAKLAGFDASLPNGRFDVGPHMHGHPDALEEDWGLWELKDLSGWSYRYLIEGRGVAYEEPRYYYQMQAYMEGAGRDWAIFVASPGDHSFLQNIMRREKKYGKGYELPPIYVEVVPKREPDVEHVLARAEMIHNDTQLDIPPPREYDGRQNWPCAYCPFQHRCIELYG